MKEYEIKITETLQRTVTAEADSREEAEQLVSDKWHNSEYILDADDFTGVSFAAKEAHEVEISYGEMRNYFRQIENKRNNQHLCGYIVFMADSFKKEYSELSRTYCVSSDNKAFQPNKGGYSIYGSCLDGSESGVRLEQYMAAERGGKDGWKIERCYMTKDEYDKMKALTFREKDKER